MGEVDMFSNDSLGQFQSLLFSVQSTSKHQTLISKGSSIQKKRWGSPVGPSGEVARIPEESLEKFFCEFLSMKSPQAKLNNAV